MKNEPLAPYDDQHGPAYKEPRLIVIPVSTIYQFLKKLFKKDKEK